MMKIFSFDAEVDGLYGPAFAIAVTIRENGREVASFVGRCPDELVGNEWVRANILPALGDMPVTHSSSEKLEESFWDFWIAQKEGVIVIAHCGSPVESGLFRRCVERDLASRAFAGPYPAIHDVATVLLALGEDPASVDSYNERHSIVVPFNGSAHHPMYDATAAAVAWEHATTKLKHVVDADVDIGSLREIVRKQREKIMEEREISLQRKAHKKAAAEAADCELIRLEARKRLPQVVEKVLSAVKGGKTEIEIEPLTPCPVGEQDGIRRNQEFAKELESLLLNEDVDDNIRIRMFCVIYKAPYWEGGTQYGAFDVPGKMRIVW